MKWISVKDKLPELKQDVLALFENHHGLFARVSFMYLDDDGEDDWTRRRYWDGEPSHWMPLPEFPQENE